MLLKLVFVYYEDNKASILSLQQAVLLDNSTTSSEWTDIVEFLGTSGFYEVSLQVSSHYFLGCQICAQSWSDFLNSKTSI